MVSKEVEKLLLKVQKPGRYVGGELNSTIKDWNCGLLITSAMNSAVSFIA